MDIIADILEPVGLPLVDAYYKLKENVFLNTFDEKQRGLERLGNFFLTPARYLLNGKKITHLDFKTKSCKISQAFSPSKSALLDILKTAFAIIALSPALLIGSALKGLGYISSKTQLKHRIILEEATTVKDIAAKIDANKALYQSFGMDTTVKKSFCNLNPIEKPKLGDPNLPPKILKTLQKQQIDIARLSEIAEILTKEGIVWWADFGTCLGTYRHNGMIPWDEDIDIAILEKDHTLVKNLLKEKLDKKKFAVWDFSPASKPQSLLKIHLKETNMLIDIYHYTIDQNSASKNLKPQVKITYEFSHIHEWWIPKEAKKREPTHSYSPEIIFPLKKAKFGDANVLVPRNIEAYLLEKYARSEKSRTKKNRLEELKPCRIWNAASQTFAKVEGHPYFKQSSFNS